MHVFSNGERTREVQQFSFRVYEKQQISKKSEAIKKIIILSNVRRESDEKFKSDLNDILEDLANRVDLVELETRYLVNQRKHKDTLPKELTTA